MSAAEEVKGIAECVQASLMSQLATARQGLGLSQAELAARAGTSRMTVQRCEAENADTTLSTFLALALALQLTPRLHGAEEGNSESYVPASKDIIHRGTHYNRTKHDLQWDDRKREQALAQAWEAANEHRDVGLAPILQTLVPHHTQEQASAVATVIQWLGTEIGFEFLSRALARAGYQVTERKAKR